MDNKQINNPTRSEFSNGPITANRLPNPSLTTKSTISASQTPFSTSAMASRFSACCSLLPTNPGISFLTWIADLPIRSNNPNILLITSGSVKRLWITYTKGTRCGGFQKWVPTIRSGSFVSLAICSIGIPEVFVAKIVSADVSWTN